MSGVKNDGVAFIEQVNQTTFEIGKSTEKMKIYLEKLMTFNPGLKELIEGEEVYVN